MKVYIVVTKWDYEELHIQKVFEDEALAQQYAEGLSHIDYVDIVIKKVVKDV